MIRKARWRQKPSKGRFRSIYPIILAHGLCPFDQILRPFSKLDNRDDDRFHYFRKIRSTLAANGFEAFHSRVSWAGSLARRASDLKREITRITDNFSKWPRVHIIAHSMGGLDARLMIVKYRMADRVASLTTIGTPHWGSSFADWRMKRYGALLGLVRPLRDSYRIIWEEEGENDGSVSRSIV